MLISEPGKNVYAEELELELEEEEEEEEEVAADVEDALAAIDATLVGWGAADVEDVCWGEPNLTPGSDARKLLISMIHNFNLYQQRDSYNNLND